MPDVSVIVPCYNEQATITLLLNALVQQTYPLHDLEVIIADALSEDQTRQKISEFQSANPQLSIRVLDNPKRTIPSAVNIAIKAAEGSYIVRLDAHCIPRPDYIERCVQALKSDSNRVVGGVWNIQPSQPSPIARAIATAAAHPLGVGDAHYRHTQKAQFTDTVPFGSFHRKLIDRVGFYDETLLSNEDYEFNTRVRQAGGKIWLDPQISSVYFARGDLASLARQYFRYGFWKHCMLRRYPRTLRWRQALPPLFVLILALSLVGSLFFPPLLVVFGLILGVYLLVLIIVGIGLSIQKKDGFLWIGFPLAVAVMHNAWGSGFLWSFLSRCYEQPDKR